MNKIRNPWKTVEKRVIYQNKYGYKLRDDKVITPKGTEGSYMVIETRGIVFVVAITRDKKVLLVRQWRYPIEEESLELPCGTIENANDDPLDVAKRELLEEAHATSNEWYKLGTHWVENGIMAKKAHVYLALNPTIVPFDHEETDEEIFRETIAFDKAINMVTTGKFSDGRTQLGLLLAKEFLTQKKLLAIENRKRPSYNHK